jgi:Uma2 family endonuclease
MATDNTMPETPFSSGPGYIPYLLTAADLAEMPSELPSGPVRFELDNGVLITMAPPGFDHGHTENSITYALRHYGEMQGFGISSGETGIVLRRNPDSVVGPDAAFISKGRLPIKRTPEGYLETIPDLVVEVVSKNDTRKYLARKTNEYLQAGVAIVWLVDPAKRTLVEHRPGQEPRTFDATATVELPELIPGFQLRLADVFAPV